ncbi:hypothetical protein GW17_00043962 [Ensete ventricosum]|nr:hypothetical protein GW17_00043962 [Ensete ventricosum]
MSRLNERPSHHSRCIGNSPPCRVFGCDEDFRGSYSVGVPLRHKTSDLLTPVRLRTFPLYLARFGCLRGGEMDRSGRPLRFRVEAGMVAEVVKRIRRCGEGGITYGYILLYIALSSSQIFFNKVTLLNAILIPRVANFLHFFVAVSLLYNSDLFCSLGVICKPTILRVYDQDRDSMFVVLEMCFPKGRLDKKLEVSWCWGSKIFDAR